MKNSSLGTKILMAVICLTVLAYFGIQGYRYFANPLTTTLGFYKKARELGVHFVTGIPVTGLKKVKGHLR